MTNNVFIVSHTVKLVQKRSDRVGSHFLTQEILDNTIIWAASMVSSMYTKDSFIMFRLERIAGHQVKNCGTFSRFKKM